MPGVRIHHPSLRNTMVVYELLHWPYPGGPYLCGRCNKAHVHKAVHLDIDNEGDTVVGEENWDSLKEYVEKDFKVLNRIARPEPLVLGMGNGHKEAFHVEFREL